MSLLVLTSRYLPVYSGAAIQEHRVFRELAAAGLEVEVLTLSQPGLSKSERVDSVSITRAGSISRWGRMRFYLACALKAMRSAGDKRTVLAMSGGWGSYLGIWLGDRVGHKAILRLSLDGADDPVAVRRQSLGALKLRLMRAAHHVICLTPALVDRCRSAGIPEERIWLIPNAVDQVLFDVPSETEKSETRARLSLSGGRQVAIFLGAVTERKGILELLDAWERIGENHPTSMLLICGPALTGEHHSLDPGYLEQVHRRIRAPGLRDRVRITGRLGEAEVRDHLWSADLYVSMSRAEGLANAILEAMAVGLPVLTLARPGDLDGVITEDREGWLVDPAEEARFLSLLDDLLADQGRLATAGKAAGRRIRESFSLEKKIAAYRELLTRESP